jgi:hypothetical protein
MVLWPIIVPWRVAHVLINHRKWVPQVWIQKRDMGHPFFMGGIYKSYGHVLDNKAAHPSHKE